MTVAVTGATGFAGRPAIAELLKRGHRVTALVRNPARAALPPVVNIVEGDLLNGAALAALVQGADAVLHLAGAIAAANPGDYFKYNSFPTRVLAEAARRAGVKRFVHVSSLAARQPELSAYGASKRAGEDALQPFASALQLLVLRPPAIYGPGDRGTLPLIKELTHPIALIPGGRMARFSLIHVEDVARVLADAVASDVTGLRELSDGKAGGYGWDELIAIAEAAEGRIIRPIFLPRPLVAGVAVVASLVSRLTGRPGMVDPGKVAELYHPDWVSRGPGWPLDEPITFERGLPMTLAWYRAAGWLPRKRKPDRSSATSSHEA